MGEAIGAGGLQDASRFAKGFERGGNFAGGLHDVEVPWFENASGFVGLGCESRRDSSGWAFFIVQLVHIFAGFLSGFEPCLVTLSRFGSLGGNIHPPSVADFAEHGLYFRFSWHNLCGVTVPN